MGCNVAEALGISFTRRQRDRVLLTLGWATFVGLEVLHFRKYHITDAIWIVLACTLFVTFVAGVAAARRRERRFGRIRRLPKREEVEGKWRFRTAHCCRVSRVLALYCSNDILPVIATNLCWAAIVAGLLTSAVGIASSGAFTTIETGAWIGCVVMQVATFLIITGLMLTFRRPNTSRPTIGWQLCCAISIAIFYAVAVSGFTGPLGLGLGALVGNFVFFFVDAQSMAWVSVGLVFVVCCMCPAICYKLIFRSRSSKVAFNAEWGPGGKLVPVFGPDQTRDDYISLFEFPLEDMDPRTLAALARAALGDVADKYLLCCLRWRCPCCKAKEGEGQATEFQATFDSPVDPLMADALAAGRLLATRGVMARGANVNGVHNGKTMLMHAVDGGSLECFQMLLAQKRKLNLNFVAEPFGTSDEGLSILHYVVQQGPAGVPFLAPLLSNPGMNVKIGTSNHGYTPLMMAVRQQNVEAVTQMTALPKKKLRTLLQATAKNGMGVTQDIAKLVRKGPGKPLQICKLVLDAQTVLGLPVDKRTEKRVLKLLQESMA